MRKKDTTTTESINHVPTSQAGKISSFWATKIFSFANKQMNIFFWGFRKGKLSFEKECASANVNPTEL